MRARWTLMREWLRYHFDSKIADGPATLLGLLGLAALIVVAIAGIAVYLLRIAPRGQPPLDLAEGLWESLMRVLDPGTMGNDTGWHFRGIMLLVTIAGLLTIAALINIVHQGLDRRLESLRKGRSRVIETGHTVVLNWSPAVFEVVQVLAEANRSLKEGDKLKRRPVIVILADRDKVEMADAIAERVRGLGQTKVICRRGDPTDLLDLGITRPERARAIIVLSPGGDDPDLQVVKTALALTHGIPLSARVAPVVAHLRDEINEQLVTDVGKRANTPGGPGEIEGVRVVLADRLIAQVIAQSCRRSGLGDVYEHLLEFTGVEIYVSPQKSFGEVTFGQVLFGLEQSIAVGLIKANGDIRLNPGLDHRIDPGDRLLTIAEDDDAGEIGTFTRAGDVPSYSLRSRLPRRPEKTLILGWNRRGPLILKELARYAASGSRVMVVADRSELCDEAALRTYGHGSLHIDCKRASSTDRAIIEQTKAGDFDNVVVLGDCDQSKSKVADTQALITLLHLGKPASGAKRPKRIVGEVTDVRNRELAKRTGADDYIVSSRLVSLMLAQVAENPLMHRVFGKLLEENGPEIRLNDAADSGFAGSAVSFAEVMARAAEYGEIAIGYDRPCRTDDGCRSHKITLNPNRHRRVTFVDGDQIIVISAGADATGAAGRRSSRTIPTTAAALARAGWQAFNRYRPRPHR